MQITGLPQVKLETIEGVSLRSLFLLIFNFRHSCRVVGESMIPTICPGDFVIYKPIKGVKFNPSEGTIVIAKDPLDPKGLTVKRILKYNNKGIILRGDNYINSIDSRQYGFIHPNNLFGIVEKIISP
ncbi:nickel-type superoxide dismutase maturation protease [Prochlorococcus sp. MIT 1341]|uniref:nickel-type superoxide dismutase maturation protease n=1 Tax=Prochlorococcus sp. MIT 1341 TaxID=3096221 RepID=UPI002A758F15|nr:nickel-type superoxide dismutase maturation protease [Prochlorococcus sp. MIT 1341]